MTPLELAEEPPQRVRFLNSVFDADRCCELSIGEGSHQVRFNADFTPLHADFGFCVTDGQSRELWVALAGLSCLTELDGWLGGATLQDLPDEVAAIVLDDRFAETLEKLGASVGESFEITRVCSAEPSVEAEYSVPFVVTNGAGRATRGALLFGGDWTPIVKSLLAFAPVASLNEIDSMRIPAPIELGRSWLTPADLDAIEPYDVIMLDESEYLSNHRARVVLSSGMQIECDTHGERLTVANIPAIAADHPRSTPGSDEFIDRAKLPLAVHAGEAQATLGQLRGLGPGDVLDVRRPLHKTVDISLAGRPIGEGELVKCGDRLGVRLLALRSRKKYALRDDCGAG